MFFFFNLCHFKWHTLFVLLWRRWFCRCSDPVFVPTWCKKVLFSSNLLLFSNWVRSGCAVVPPPSRRGRACARNKTFVFFFIKIKLPIKNKGLPESSGNSLTLPFVFLCLKCFRCIVFVWCNKTIKKVLSNTFIHTFTSIVFGGK